jgi:ribonuclease HII
MKPCLFCYHRGMKSKWIVGVDEVGRGPVAGPVSVCVCAISVDCYKKMSASWRRQGLTDSKKMTSKQREVWYEKAKVLQKNGDIQYVVVSRSASTIDNKGIQVAIRECIAKGFEKLDLNPKDTTVYLDGGLRAPAEYENQTTIIKGDIKERSISLASVIAKVTRDAYMVKMAKKYPLYGFGAHKGYGTRAHYIAIAKKGIISLHRKSYLTKIKYTVK